MAARRISIQVPEELFRDLWQLANRDCNGLAATCRRLLSLAVLVESGERAR